jgi:hypothetical protein
MSAPAVLAVVVSQGAARCAISWDHCEPDKRVQVSDGVFWVAVKGSDPFDLPGATSRQVTIRGENWVIATVPDGKFLHDTPGRHLSKAINDARAGRETCAKCLLVDVHLIDKIRGAAAPALDCPQLLNDGVDIPETTMTWDEAAAVQFWDAPTFLKLSIAGLDDGRTRKMRIHGIYRITLTPVLTAVLSAQCEDTLNLGVIPTSGEIVFHTAGKNEA